MSDLTFHKLSWNQLARDCIELYPKLKDIEVDRILSISRGGTVVSRIFSDLMGTLPISHITISSYHDLKKLSTPILTEEPTTNFANQSILIIDEVSDTGETFHIAVDHFKKKSVKKIYTLSPYIKPHTKFKPDFWIKNLDAWIIFPYDIRETAEAFEKMFGGKDQAKAKLLEVGFTEIEIQSVIV